LSYFEKLPTGKKNRTSEGMISKLILNVIKGIEGVPVFMGNRLITPGYIMGFLEIIDNSSDGSEQVLTQICEWLIRIDGKNRFKPFSPEGNRPEFSEEGPGKFPRPKVNNRLIQETIPES
jgi:hypothetical protein